MRNGIRWVVVLGGVLAALAAPRQGSAQMPRSIAGFSLGDGIEKHRDVIDKNDVDLRYREYLSEARVENAEGFKIVYLTYGNCRAPGRIVRIKAKYPFADKEFFEKIFERFQKKFGKPDEYQGDAFQAYIAWKWSFKDTDGSRMSLILQHYRGGDDEETPGNSVKMTMTSFVEEERKCYEDKHPEAADEGSGEPKIERPRSDEDFERFLPH